MSRDIRSFFNAMSKKTGTKQEVKKPPPKIVDSDEEIIEDTPKKQKKTKKANIINSDSEEESNKPSKSKPKKESPKLKQVNVSDIFKNETIKQSKVEPIPKKEKETKEKASKKRKKSPTELGVHEDEDFEKTLMELDDDILIENADILDQSIQETIAKESKQGSSKENSPNKKEATNEKRVTKANKSPVKKETEKRKLLKDEEVETPKKKRKLNESLNSSYSTMSPQEAHENRRMMYNKYLNRGDPKNHGNKTYPEGTPTCLKDLTFLRTGVLDSLLGDEFQELVTKHGGRVVHAVSKKVNYVVVGDEPGPAKLAKAESYGIPNINEDEFLDMILTKSGKSAHYVKQNSESDSAIGTSQSEEFMEFDEVISSPKKPANSPKKDFKEVSSPKKQPAPSTSPKKSPVATTTTKTITTTTTTTKQKSEQPDENLPWTEKYRPKDLKQVIGQQSTDSVLSKLYNWLKNWHSNRQLKTTGKVQGASASKCALLSGPPGVGKTTMSSLVAKSLGFDVVEFNASDTRSQRLLKEEVSELVKCKTLAGFMEGQKQTNMKRVLLMDEVDGMAGNEDRGGIQGLIQIIKDSSVPIICMCNDRYNQKIKSLATYCFDLRVTPPKPEQIKGYLKSICFREGLNVSYETIGNIVRNTDGDLRQALNYLSLWSVQNNEITGAVAKGEDRLIKDTVLGPWEVVQRVFKQEKGTSIAERSRLFFYDYSINPLFVQENYLNVVPFHQLKGKISENKETLLRVSAASDAISYGALVEQKIRSTNNWSLLDSQAMYSSVLPGYYMHGTMRQPQFPGWLGKNSKRTKLSRMVTEIHIHSKPKTSCSKMAILMDYVNPLRERIMSFLDKEHIQDAVDFLQLYHLSKEDYDNMMEIMCLSTTRYPQISAKTKGAFTRLYKKTNPIVTRKLKKIKDDNEEGEEDEEDEESDDDDITKNAAIKVVKKDEASASTSKGKGKGKAKEGAKTGTKTTTGGRGKKK